MHFSSARLHAATLMFALLCTSASVRAELGGTMPMQPDGTGKPPASLLNGALRQRTLTDAGGTTINEYATSTGQIVAYTWQGPTMPDLRALLGQHMDSYSAGVAALPPDGNLHASQVVRPDVIVQAGGPMRAYVGRAWLPAALPPGVTASDLH
jgi:hypothetical protein